MPLAHICPACGSQLARTRAIADAVYALPIVACPCGYAVVRRRHPILSQFRRIRAAVSAFIFLILHILVLTALSLAAGGFVSSLEKDLKDIRQTPLSLLLSIPNPSGRSRPLQSWIEDGGGLIFLIGFTFTSFVVGMWLRVALAHWRWPTPLLAWALLVSAWVWLESLIWPLTWLDGVIAGKPARYSGLGLTSSLHCLQILFASILISTAAAPIGRIVSRSLIWSRQRRFIKILNKRRKARRGE